MPRPRRANSAGFSAEVFSSPREAEANAVESACKPSAVTEVSVFRCVTPLAAGHAGAVFGGNAASSAVWDGVSTSAPAYRAATIGVAGGFAQPASPTSVVSRAVGVSLTRAGDAAMSPR